MLDEHDQDVLLRCRRLGHEVKFGYCRHESHGMPCRLILDCWWESFDVRAFLHAHLPEETITRFERGAVTPPPSKVLSLVEMIEQTKRRLSSASPDSGKPRKGVP